MATETAAQIASAAAKAARQTTNEHTAACFAAAMLGLALIFSAAHWIDVVLSCKDVSKEHQTPSTGLLLLRRARSLLLRRVCGFPTLGHALMFVVYIIINIILSLHTLDWSALTNFAKRLGWVATCNIALIIFLALKNTPLAFLTSQTYDRLNILHQAAGYTTVVWTLLHTVVYITAWSYTNNLSELLETSNVMGIVAGFSMIVILLTALFLRTRKGGYETFYVVHIVFFMLIMIAVGLHRPSLATKSVIIVIFGSAIWAADRLFRMTRLLWYALGNSAALVPLACGGVRVTLSRRLRGAVAGQHVFLYMPGIRLFQTHPFTIVATNPLELVIAAQDGFTKELKAHAENNPDSLFRGSVEGPYGLVPKWNRYQQVVLIAGGSGASFVLGTAAEIAWMSSTTAGPTVHVIWTLRDKAQLSWFSKELSQLMASSSIILTIHITGSISESLSSAGIAEFEPEVKSKQIAVSNTREVSTSSTTTPSLDEKSPPSTSPPFSMPINDIEKSLVITSFGPADPTASSLSTSSIPITYGRPDIKHLIGDLVASTRPHERTIVAACGPDGLMRSVRAGVSDVVGRGDRSVELYCEQFGW